MLGCFTISDQMTMISLCAIVGACEVLLETHPAVEPRACMGI